MSWFIKIVLSALAVLISAYVIPGVSVKSFWTALWVAVVLALLNAFVKPILTVLTIPITIVTLGLFLLVINVIIIYIADYLIAGFNVDGFLPALLFSLALSVVGWLLSAIVD
ncbi:MAG: phage holin family protein [Cytophagales bacterium]|jgi:putative membrane protein|nr:phage holin family protein [Cytophagales bacterium]